MNQVSSFRLIGLAGLGALLAVPALGQSSSHFYGGVGAGVARSANETARTTDVLLPGVDTLSSSSDRNDNAFNQPLSDARTASVKDYLVIHGRTATAGGPGDHSASWRGSSRSYSFLTTA